MGFIDETALGSLDLLSRTWKKHLHTVKKAFSFIPSKDQGTVDDSRHGAREVGASLYRKYNIISKKPMQLGVLRMNRDPVTTQLYRNMTRYLERM